MAKYIIVIILFCTIPFQINGKSLKRGICWEEGRVNLNEHHASLMSPGVSWVYNWGPDAANSAVYSENFYFVPMAWNGDFDSDRIRAWLSDHPETKYILGFNEPNFSDQANMTPARAVKYWPELEAIAEEFDVKLVGPALNFSGSEVGGKVWGIYEWMDEFFRLYPNAKIDCLALHCYMNWWSATNWFATEYYYKDLFSPQNENYGKFPYLVKYLEDFREKNGSYPPMMLTEFCAWEPDYLPDVYFQIDQMTQKIQKLEQNDLIEGYAWFMGNPNEGASAFPYMGVFEKNTADSKLSELGNVYVNMSSFDTSRHYYPGEIIMAKDYIDASTDNNQVKVRSNTDGSNIPLQIEIPGKGQTKYLVNIPSDGVYVVTLHLKTQKTTSLALVKNTNKIYECAIENTDSIWKDVTMEVTLNEGAFTLVLYNSGNNPIVLNSIKFESKDSGMNSLRQDYQAIEKIYSVSGISYGDNIDELTPGLYVVRMQDGKTIKIKK